jgi:hypothetical protein
MSPEPFILSSSRLVFTAVLILVITAAAFGDRLSHVAHSDPVYPFLERMAIQGKLSHFDGTTRPVRRGIILDALEELCREKEDGALTGWEEAVLLKVLRRFSPETYAFWRDRGARKRMLVRSVHSELELFGELLAGGRVTGRDDGGGWENTSRFTAGAAWRGCIPDADIGFTAVVKDTRVQNCRSRGEGEREPGEEILLRHGSSCYTDESTGSVVWYRAPFECAFGKEVLRWGPAYHWNTGLSSFAGSFPYLMVKVELNRLTFIEMLGFLRSLEEDTLRSYPVHGFNRSLERSKHIVSHRLSYRVSPKLNLSAYETVIYGDRCFEPVYTVPLILMWSAEHYLGDRDNYCFGIEADGIVRPGLRWHGSIFVDELYLAKMFDSRESRNVFACSTGCWLVNPFDVHDVNIFFEIVLISPWVYRHKFPVNTYTHNGFLLGHPDGENSLHSYLDVEFPLTHELTFRLSLDYALKGESRDIDAYTTPPAEKLLGEPLSDSRGVGLRLRYDPLWCVDLFGMLEYTYERRDLPFEEPVDGHSFEGTLELMF